MPDSATPGPYETPTGAAAHPGRAQMTPGELAAVRAKHPCWRIWVSDEGGFYATRPRYSALAAGASVTVYGATPAGLDEAIAAAEAEYEQVVAGPSRRCLQGRRRGMAELVAVLPVGDPLAMAFSTRAAGCRGARRTAGGCPIAPAQRVAMGHPSAQRARAQAPPVGVARADA
jgi:hypothetical protein